MDAVRFVQALRLAPEGPDFLANVAGAMEEGLVTDADIGQFFRRCAAVQATKPGAKPMACVGEVSRGDDGLTPWRRFRRVHGHDGLRLTTLVTWQTWYDYHVDTVIFTRPGAPKNVRQPATGATIDSVQSVVDGVCALRPWWRNGAEPACLGAPWTTPGNVWFSTTDFDAGHPVPADDVGGSAYRVASATGLRYPVGTWLLQYSVDAAEARALAAAEARRLMATSTETGVARPLFADGGNEWFRVCNPSAYGRHCAALEWGNTAHLGQCDTAAANDGRPERVMIRLPIGQLPSLRLRVVGQVQATAHDPLPVDAATFATFLRCSGTLDAIVHRVQACLV